jgi:hypothetical protein
VVVAQHVALVAGRPRVYRRRGQEVVGEGRQLGAQRSVAEERRVKAGARRVVGVDHDRLARWRGERNVLAVEQGALRGLERVGAHELDDAADPDALVEIAAELVVLGRRHARVVEGDDLPLVVEHWRARRARLGVGLVVHEGLRQVDDPVVAQRDLLDLPAGVLDDGYELADDRLPLGLDQAVEAAGHGERVGWLVGGHERKRLAGLVAGQAVDALGDPLGSVRLAQPARPSDCSHVLGALHRPLLGARSRRLTLSLDSQRYVQHGHRLSSLPR